MSNMLLQPEEHVLSTLERDGSRRWLQPRLSRGVWLVRRRVVAWLLVALFTALPFVRVGDRPIILLDIPARRFTIFGYTFLPTDTVLLALFMVGVLLGIFLLTALVGRVWCGWACPQTVYMEFFFRPIERLFCGTPGKGGPPKSTRPKWIQALRFPVFLLLSFCLANIFLAYFVGVDRLWTWMHQSPFRHPTPFFVVAFVTLAMMLDFAYFREQVCLIMCPYGRFQSVLLDQSSLIVSYDSGRGEPRGKAKQKQAATLPVLGDCVDCKMCVTTCPTGIDIRKGLQMECINCTQCIDACNSVMRKLGRAPNLIRYSSQRHDRGEGAQVARPRIFLYPTLLAIIAGLFVYLLVTKPSFNVELLRERGNPYALESDGQLVRNLLRLKLTNRSDQPMGFRVDVARPAEVSLEISESEMRVEASETQTFHIAALAPRGLFVSGRSDIELQIQNDKGAASSLAFRLLGPR